MNKLYNSHIIGIDAVTICNLVDVVMDNQRRHTRAIENGLRLQNFLPGYELKVNILKNIKVGQCLLFGKAGFTQIKVTSIFAIINDVLYLYLFYG